MDLTGGVFFVEQKLIEFEKGKPQQKWTGINLPDKETNASTSL